MPPPRLLRPLRPCHSPWGSFQLRWASDGVRDKLHAPHGDFPQTPDPEQSSHGRFERGKCGQDIEQDVPSRRANGASPDAQSQPQSQEPRKGWWGSVFGNVSSMTPKDEHIGSRSQAWLPRRPATLGPPTKQENPVEERRSGQHIAALRNNRLNTEVVEERGGSQHIEASEDNSNLAADEDAATSSTSWRRPNKKVRTCPGCHTKFRTSTQMHKHLLRTESCWVKIPDNERLLYRCRRCSAMFPTREQARFHADITQSCERDMYLRVLDANTTMFGRVPFESLKGVLTNAQMVYLQSTKALVQATQTLNAFPSFLVNPFRTRLRQHLRQTWEKAQSTDDIDMLAILKRYFGPNHPGSKQLETTTHEQAISIEGQVMPPEIKIQKYKSGPEFRLNRYYVPDDSAKPKTSTQNGGGKSVRQDENLRIQIRQLSEQVKNLQTMLSSLTSSTEGNSNGQMNKDPSHLELRARRSDEPKAFPQQETNHAEDATRSKLLELPFVHGSSLEPSVDRQGLTRQIHAKTTLMTQPEYSSIVKSVSEPIDSEGHIGSKGAQSTKSQSAAAVATTASTEQSLLDELFPEAGTYIQPHYSSRNPYPKLDLPNSIPLVRREAYDRPKSEREKIIEAFQQRTDQITVLQLLHCSTELTEADFRRLIPKGKHIETWTREGEFYKIIPGRDPLSLERLPFYYLLFKSPESALAYQANASRLHKLSQLHQPSSIFSAIPPPKGFLEDGEDVSLSTSSYRLKPTGLKLNLNMLMKPYNRALGALIERGGYEPIAPSISDKGEPIWKVLMHIEGYEPSPLDLFQLLAQDGYSKGIQWPFYNEQLGIHRLRDVVDLKARLLPVSAANPRAANPDKLAAKDDDASLNFLYQESQQDRAIHINQMVMNRVYNRWVIDFTEEDAARRFARLWNRRMLPLSMSAKHVTWRDVEEPRICNTEFLW